MIGYASQEVELRVTQTVVGEQAAGVVDRRPMESTIPGVPVTAQQGLWGDVPPLDTTTSMPTPTWHVTDPWRAPNAMPAAEPGKGAGKERPSDYHMFGVQMQQRQTLIQHVELSRSAQAPGPTAAPLSVEQLHTASSSECLW